MGAVQLSQHDGAFPGMVSRSGRVLFVGGVLLFVHNDEPQLVMGQEQGAAGAQHQVGLPLPKHFGHQFALAGRNAAMI